MSQYQIQPDDEESLRKMLGLSGELPADICAEYALRKRLYDRGCAGGGRLGTLGLVDVVRACGKQAPDSLQATTKIDWRKFPQDGTVRVEAGPFTGEWRPGVFLGFVEAGTLAIRMDDDHRVVECRRDMVRLMGDPIPVAVKPEVPAYTLKLDEATIKALKEAPDDEWIVVPEPTLIAAPPLGFPAPESIVTVDDLSGVYDGRDGAGREDDEDDDDTEDTEILDDAEEVAKVLDHVSKLVQDEAAKTDTVKIPGMVDWDTMQTGVQVWVNSDEDVFDGKFVKSLGNGQVVVSVDGQEGTRKVPAENVYLAG